MAGLYRTALLHTSDMSFDKEDEFLRAHGFATILDVDDLAQEVGSDAPRNLKTQPSASSEPLRIRTGAAMRRLEKGPKKRHEGNPLAPGWLSFLPDRFLLPAAWRWIDANRSQPFFLVLWTIQTHHPYVTELAEQPFAPGNESLNRYLNAIREADQPIGDLHRGLEERSLAESTLLVVLGDHGQAFGQHGTLVHGRSLYDEEVRVPLVMAHPRLGGRLERTSVLGQQTDIAPTLIDLLGLQTPSSWQGQSLFARHRSGRTYLFTAFNDYLFGVVDGDRKYIYSAATDRRELYDLSRDPSELTNRAELPEEREQVQASQRRLAAWLHFQNAFLSARRDDDRVGRP